MSRVNDQDVMPLLDAAATWRQRCLLDGLSVFTDEPLWTANNVQQLHAFFVDNPLTGKRDSYDKQQIGVRPKKSNIRCCQASDGFSGCSATSSAVADNFSDWVGWLSGRSVCVGRSDSREFA